MKKTRDFLFVKNPASEVSVKKIAYTMVLASAVVLAGCSKKAEGQVVAVVNGQEITEQQLNAAIQAANVPAGADKKRVTQEILKSMIERAALVQKANSEGVEKSPEYVSKLQSAKDAISLEIYAQRLKRNMKAPDEATINEYIAKNPNIFASRRILDLDQVLFPILTDKGILQQMASIHSLDALAAFLQTHNIKFTRQKSTLDSMSVKQEFLEQVTTLPAGEPFIVPDAGRFVANSITGVRPNPVPGDRTHDIAVELIGRAQLSKELHAAQNAAVASAKVSYREGMAPVLVGK